MSTRPIMMSLDTLALPQLRDLMAARVSDLPRDQHALMSAWGGPPQVASCYYYATASTIQVYGFTIWAPPGVTEVGIGVLMSGNGTLEFNSAFDTWGSRFTSAVVYGDEPSMETATRAYNGTVLTASSSNDAYGRALTVRTAAEWGFQDVDLTVTITPSPELYIYEMSFVPLHVPR